MMYAIVKTDDDGTIRVIETFTKGGKDLRQKVTHHLRQWHDTVFPTAKLSVMELKEHFRHKSEWNKSDTATKGPFGYIVAPL